MLDKHETSEESNVQDGSSHKDNNDTTLRQRMSRTEGEPGVGLRDIPKANRNIVKIAPLKKAHAVGHDSTNESLNSSRSSSDAKMMLKHFEFLRIVMCIMVAYVCRRVLSSGYGILYFQVRFPSCRLRIQLECYELDLVRAGVQYYQIIVLPFAYSAQ